MKQINEYRRSEHFNIGGIVLDYLSRVNEYYRDTLKEHVVAVVPTPNEDGDAFDMFTVRSTANDYAIYDRLLRVDYRSVKILEIVTICEPRSK